MTTDDNAITVPQFTAQKAAGRKITMLTAYDYPTAQLVDAAGVEGILVGDSLATVVQGHANTLPVTLEEMIETLRVVADRPLGAIRFQPDPAIMAIYRGWAQRSSFERATALGLARDEGLQAIVRAYIEDFLGAPPTVE